MLTKQEVLTSLSTQAADAFRATLAVCVEHGSRTPDEAAAYTSRLERALVIVTEHPASVRQISPTIYDVVSTGTDKSKVWRVDQTCTCPDAREETGKAPRGWCKHRFAAYLTLMAERALDALRVRMHGLPIPHDHTCVCGHGPDTVQCWDETCVEHVVSVLCPQCLPPDNQEKIGMPIPEEQTSREGCAEAFPAYNERECQQAPVYHEGEQYEEAPVVQPKQPAPCEALSSFNLKVKKGNIEGMWTLRSMLPGAQGDADVTSRLPRILNELRQLGFTITTDEGTTRARAGCALPLAKEAP